MADKLRCSFYYSDFGYPSKAAELIVKAMPDIHVVFRYRFAFFEDAKHSYTGTDYNTWNNYFLYDHFEKLSQKQVEEAERMLGTTFTTLRISNKVAFLRYPSDELPDDQYLANLVYSWVNFFRTKKINLFITTLVDETPGVVGLEVARALKIPTVILSGSKFSDSYIWADAYFQPIFYKRMSKEQKEEALKKAIGLTKGTVVLNKDFSKIAQERFSIRLSKGFLEQTVFGFLRNLKMFYSRIPKVHRQKERRIWYTTAELVSRQLKYFFRSLIANHYFSEDPDYSEKFVLFPLHFIDDASITLRAPFADQFKLIEDISRTLPMDTVLYVKPHPHWRCMDIPIDIMKRLRRLSNVRLLKYSTKTKELIQHADSVFIINSTVGFEALVYGKRVFTFGDDYPDSVAPHIDSSEQLLHLDDKKVSQEDVDDFIAKHYFHTIFQKNPYWVTLDFENEDDIRQLFGVLEDVYKNISRNV